ncbi:type II secretion system F family protein [Actinoplanes sp. NPDC026619]|uniref:type II secretion system F family protein n=1 Tax=Actinoplanes sp. NPDC026619 TaxID=3155798 RepID=UPI003406FA71
MSGWGWAAAVSGAAATFLIVYVILDVIFGRTPEQRRIASLKVFTHVERNSTDPIGRQILAALGLFVEESPALARFAARSEPLLDQLTGAPKPHEWLSLRFLSSIGTFLLFVLVLPAWFAVLVGFVLGFHLPPIVLRSRIRRRRKRFADELPNMLQLVLSSLRSGFTLQQSVEAAVRDDEGPVAEELSRALSESRISGEFEDALQRVGERTQSGEMNWLVMALRLQREVGGSLADVMQTTADTMRDRAYLRRQVQTLSAEGRMSAYVLMALPFFTGIALTVSRPGYIRPLYTEPLGMVMLAGAALLMTIGFVWLRAAVKIDV